MGNKKLTIGILLLVLGVIVGMSLYVRTSNGNLDVKRHHVCAILPLTGRLAEMGQHVKKGILLYCEKYPDFPFEFAFYDSAGNPAQGISVYKQVSLKSTPEILLSATTGVSESLIPLAAKDGTFVLIAISNVERILRGKKNVQRFTDRSIDMILPIAQYVQKKYSSITIIHSDDGEGTATYQSMFKSLPKGFKVNEVTYPISAIDVRAEISKAISFNSDIIYISGSGSAYINGIRILKDNSCQFIADSTFADPAVLKALGRDAYHVPYVGSRFSADVDYDEKAKNFKLDFRKMFGESPFITASYSYDMCAVLDYFDKNSIEITQSSFERLGLFHGVSGLIRFLPGGECSPTFELLEINENGEIVPFAKD